MTEREVRSIVSWFAGRFGLGGWKLTIYFRSDPPPSFDLGEDAPGTETVSAAEVALRFEDADIWISPKRCRERKVGIAGALMHELIHVALAKAGIEDDTTDRAELLWDRLADVLLGLYLLTAEGR